MSEVNDISHGAYRKARQSAGLMVTQAEGFYTSYNTTIGLVDSGTTPIRVFSRLHQHFSVTLL